ncbi:MAG TPA: GH3 auxin-responsive promoter family protein [Candidatus Limnocylindrales bacterium]|nr:GH3 auxin-responsive promoter family protein [Candidatus Limnocylindrales bacterium]
MITGLAAGALDWYAGRRRRALEAVSRDAASVQERTLLRLVAQARDTEIGRLHGFHRIRSVTEYQERVPLRGYLEFRPFWQRAIAGAADITWPGRIRHWVKTSGTTAGDKLLPVSTEAFASHRRGGWDALLMAAERVGAARLLGGPMLFLGGSTALTRTDAGALVGDLSGLAVRRLPPGIRRLYAPGPAAAIPDWEARVETVARLAARQDLRLLAGMPSWLLILFERVLRARQALERPAPDLGRCWPNLRVLIHGGVSFAPYAPMFQEWIGRPLERIEVYPASEGFVGLETEAGAGLSLMLDYGIFHEFVPVEDPDQVHPRRHTVADVEIGRPYAVVLTTPGGLWSYILGDTVRFTGRNPLRLAITGRIRHFVNAFGENVIVEEVERALTSACRRTGAEVVEFTLAPAYPEPDDSRGGHDWLVEFRVTPDEPEDFTRIVDETLCVLNTDYRTKRHRGVGLRPPRVIALPPGAFHRWMRAQGKLGDQHKVPRVTNDRVVAEGLLAVAGADALRAATLTTV